MKRSVFYFILSIKKAFILTSTDYFKFRPDREWCGPKYFLHASRSCIGTLKSYFIQHLLFLSLFILNVLYVVFLRPLDTVFLIAVPTVLPLVFFHKSAPKILLIPFHAPNTESTFLERYTLSCAYHPSAGACQVFILQLCLDKLETACTCLAELVRHHDNLGGITVISRP